MFCDSWQKIIREVQSGVLQAYSTWWLVQSNECYRRLEKVFVSTEHRWKPKAVKASLRFWWCLICASVPFSIFPLHCSPTHSFHRRCSLYLVEGLRVGVEGLSVYFTVLFYCTMTIVKPFVAGTVLQYTSIDFVNTKSDHIPAFWFKKHWSQ